MLNENELEEAFEHVSPKAAEEAEQLWKEILVGHYAVERIAVALDAFRKRTG